MGRDKTKLGNSSLSVSCIKKLQRNKIVGLTKNLFFYLKNLNWPIIGFFVDSIRSM